MQPFIHGSLVDSSEHLPEAVAREFLGGVPLGRLPALAVPFLGPVGDVALVRALLVGHVGAVRRSACLGFLLVVRVDVVLPVVALDHARVQTFNCAFFPLLTFRFCLVDVI